MAFPSAPFILHNFLKLVLILSMLGVASTSSAGAAWSPVLQPLAQDKAEEPPSVRDLLKRVVADEDKVAYSTFNDIAMHGTEEAFKASLKVTGKLSNEVVLGRAYAAFSLYKDAELRLRGIAFLDGEANRHRRDDNRRAAARGLIRFGVEAKPELLDIARSHKDLDVRQLVIWTVLNSLAEENTADNFELIFKLTDPAVSRMTETIRKALAKIDNEKAISAMLKRLTKKATTPAWKETLLERITFADHEDINGILIRFVDDEDPTLQLLAIEAVGKRSLLGARGPLKRQLHSENGVVQRQTVIAIVRVSRSHQEWNVNVMDFIEHKSPAIRMGALVALREIGSTDAVRQMHKMMSDPNQAVRIEAIQQVGAMRLKKSIPVLFGRLELESGRMRETVATALRLLTGEDHGTATRWKMWWAGEAPTFCVPPIQVAVDLEAKRQEHQSANSTQSAFYGLELISDRVCFVVDMSGSMSAPAKGTGGRTKVEGEAPSTRLQVAKEQLMGAIEGMPNGNYFNVIFFESRVYAMEDEMVELGKASRKKAAGYIASMSPRGGTAVYDGLYKALLDEEVDAIYLLTDGDPGGGTIDDPKRIAKSIASLNSTRRIQINCISIGKNSDLLKQLAAESGGLYRAIL